MLEALAAVYLTPTTRKAGAMPENLTDDRPKRQRGALSKRQRDTLAAIRQRPRSAPELAAILGTSAEGAAQTASSLVRRGKVERIAGNPVRWRAK